MLNNIAMENFEGLRDTQVSLRKGVNYIYAPMGSGKTSVIDAIRFLFTGNIDAERMVGPYSDKACVTGELDGTIISRSIKGGRQSVKVDGMKANVSDMTDTLKKHGIDEKTMKVFLNPSCFSEMTPAERTTYILDKLAFQVPLPELCEFLDMPFDVEMAFGELVTGDPDAITTKDLDKMYSAAFDQRKDAKAELKVLQGKLANGVAKPLMSIADIDTRLNELATREAQARQARSLSEARDRAIATRKRLEDEKTAAEAEMESLKATFEGGNDTVSIQAQIDALNTRLASLNKEAGLTQGEVSGKKDVLARLDGDSCPLSPCLKCQTDKSPLKKELADEIDGLERRLDAVNQEISGIKAELDPLRKALDDARAQAATLEKIRAKQNSINIINGKLETLAIPDAPVPVPDEDFAGEKANLNSQRSLCALWEEQERLSSEAGRVKARVDILESLVQILEPKGKARQYVIETGMRPLEEFVNSNMALMNDGYSIRLDGSNGLEILCRTSDRENYRPFDTLSGGERICFSIALFDMINKMSGTRVMLLDDMDRMDAGSFEKVNALIKAIEPDYDFIICSFVSHDDLVAVANARSVLQ